MNTSSPDSSSIAQGAVLHHSSYPERATNAMAETLSNDSHFWYPPQDSSNEMSWPIPRSSHPAAGSGQPAAYFAHPLSHSGHARMSQASISIPSSWDSQTQPVLASAYYPVSGAFDDQGVVNGGSSPAPSTSSDWSSGSGFVPLSTPMPHHSSSQLVAPSPIYPLPEFTANLDYSTRRTPIPFNQMTYDAVPPPSDPSTARPYGMYNSTSSVAQSYFPHPSSIHDSRQPPPISTSINTSPAPFYPPYTSPTSGVDRRPSQVPIARRARASPVAPYPSPSSAHPSSRPSRSIKWQAGSDSNPNFAVPEPETSSTGRHSMTENEHLELAEPLLVDHITSDHHLWKLNIRVYEWIEATLDPKRRPDKTIPAPSGPCMLCPSVCKRSGTLQQHIVILHRQKLSRRAVAGQGFNLELGLAFTAAQMRSDRQPDSTADEERTAFLKALSDARGGLSPLPANAFPELRRKLMQYCAEERWIGAKCERCGVLVTRRIALEEHAPVCQGEKGRRKSADSVTEQASPAALSNVDQFTSIYSPESNSIPHSYLP